MQLQQIPRRKNIISLTPLIDIVFILLVFFMLTSSFNRQTSIDLQQAESNTTQSDVADYQILTVTEAGVELENKTLIGFDSLSEWANSLEDDQSTLVLTADDTAVVQQLLRALEQLKPILKERVSLAVLDTEKTEK